jgi:nanoRNase/pAp phosphatase (c-di-AMP/oligoRNAs hydrolase)
MANPFSKIKAARIIVTFHSLGDLDAVGSAIALSRFIGPKAVIAAPDKQTSAARKLINYTGSKVILFPELKREKGDFIIALDSSSPALMPHLVGIVPDLVVDHHTCKGGEIASKKAINDPTASSTCEMLYFMLKPKDKISAIALLLGIISDSASFKNASTKTFEAVTALLKVSGLSYSQVLPLAHSAESLTERIESLRSCQSVSAERIDEHIVALAMAKSNEAHFADMLIHMGADIAFVGCEADEGRISSRMRDSMLGRVDLPKLISEVGKAMNGTGSGHACAAGATGDKGSVREALGVCKKLAEQQILTAEKAKIRKIEW